MIMMPIILYMNVTGETAFRRASLGWSGAKGAKPGATIAHLVNHHERHTPCCTCSSESVTSEFQSKCVAISPAFLLLRIFKGELLLRIHFFLLLAFPAELFINNAREGSTKDDPVGIFVSSSMKMRF